MLHALLNKLSTGSVSAHCDVPCGIYDPSTAQVNALTVIRMVDQINELNESGINGLSEQHKLARLVAQKEEAAEHVKHEVRIIWGDYVKAPVIEKYPHIHELTHNIMLTGSKCKQHVSKDDALELLSLVNDFAQIFWETKGVDTFKANSPYAPNQPVVYPKLG